MYVYIEIIINDRMPYLLDDVPKFIVINAIFREFIYLFLDFCIYVSFLITTTNNIVLLYIIYLVITVGLDI